MTGEVCGAELFSRAKGRRGIQTVARSRAPHRHESQRQPLALGWSKSSELSRSYRVLIERQGGPALARSLVILEPDLLGL